MPTAIVIPTDMRQPMRLERLVEHDACAYRHLVGGSLEVLGLDRPPAILYLNEDGKRDGLPMNHRATALTWLHNRGLHGQDVIVGAAVIVGHPDAQGNDTSAPDDLVDVLFQRCARCGAYVYVDSYGRRIHAAEGHACQDGGSHVVDVLRATRYRVQITTENDPHWYGNELVFTAWFDAYYYGLDLAERWTVVKDIRVIPDLNDAPLETWYRLGLAEPSIRVASDPPFTRASFTGCYSIEELAEQISAARWSIGTAFHYRDLCFIALVDSGDEWLTIRHGLAVESLTLRPHIEDGTFASGG